MSGSNLNDAPLRFIIEPDRLYREWGIWEIFTDTPEGGMYVPNVDDAVKDWDRGVLRVTAVDHTTGLSTLEPWEARKSPSELTGEDVLLGAGPGYPSESWRVFYDARTMPHTLQLDSRLFVRGNAVTHYKVFKGTEIGPGGHVIGMFFDQSGNFLGENIPFELAELDDTTNLSTKVPVTAYTSATLRNGDVVTVVTYSASGHQTGYYKCLVYESSFTRPLEAGLRYITGIRLESPWISPSDPHVLEFPMNINVDSVALMGVVQYSDGERRVPVQAGGGQFSLWGIDHFVPTNEGQRVRLTLNYQPEADERSYIQGVSYNGSISERYTAHVTRVNGAYSLKLYVYPTWKGPIDGWGLEFFLFNLDRQIYYRVPNSAIEIQVGSPNFDPHDYLTVQQLAFAVNLNAIDPLYNSYRHVQTVNVSLKAQGTERRTNWTVTYDGDVIYGEGLQALQYFVNINTSRLRIDQGFATREQWFNRLYRDSQPLVDSLREPEPLEPNYFALVTKTRRYEFHVDYWQSDLEITSDLVEGETLYVEWIRRTGTGDLHLGISGLTVRPGN